MTVRAWLARTFAILPLILLAPGGTYAGGSASSTVRNSVTLSLNYQRPLSPVPVPRLKVTTRVTVPIYPGSEPTSRRFPMGYRSPVPATPYLQVAAAKFGVRASATSVEEWYSRAMTAAGWVSNTQGASGNSRTGVNQDMVGYAPRGSGPGANTNEIYIWFYAPTSNTTLIGIWATRVIAPPRPRGTYLPANIQSIRGVVYGYGTAKVRRQQVTITNPVAIARLRRAINRLSEVAAGFRSCPAIFITADLHFLTKGGRAIPVHIAEGCSVSVGTIGFWDMPTVKTALAWALAHPTH